MIERLLNKLFEVTVIVNCDRDPYLYRWYVVRTKWIALFIHRFIRGDEDRALHDHPWNFLVIPIWRGYIEHSDRPFIMWNGQSSEWKRVKVVRRVYPILGARFRRATYRHRVQLIDGKCSWSLFVRFRKCRDWGFWNPDFIQWQRWWAEKCE